jgi:hypothetical protein
MSTIEEEAFIIALYCAKVAQTNTVIAMLLLEDINFPVRVSLLSPLSR